MWLIQYMPDSEQHDQENYNKLLSILKYKNSQYAIVEFKDNKINILDIFNSPNKDFLTVDDILKKPFIPNGSVSLHEFLKDNSNNIFYGTNYDFTNLLNYISENDLLNPPLYTGYLNELYPISDNFIVRPVLDNKIITGKVMTEGEFYAFKKYAKDLPNGNEIVANKFMLNEIKHIKEEYRFFIIDGKISTYSQYVKNKKLYMSREIPKDVINFVTNIIQTMMGSFVLDVALLLNNDFKVIETNSFMCSGLYGSDIEKIVNELEILIGGK